MKRLIMFIVLVSCLTCIKILAQDTQGFFLNDWQPKAITSPSYVDTSEIIGRASTTITIDFKDTVAKVSNYLFGNNSNPWSGNMNTSTTIINCLNNLKPKVIRGPGGSYADIYFWNAATRPADVPPAAGFQGGKNPMTTDSYYDILKKTNSTGSICVNIGYARYGTSANPITTAAHYAANWVRYDKGRSKFWELGNENFGSWEAGYQIDTSLNKDHQPRTINGTLYAKICKVYIDSMRAAATEIGVDIKIGAVAMDHDVTYDTIQQHWNHEMMPQIASKVDFIIVHSYYTNYQENSTYSAILNSTTVTADVLNYINSGLKSAGLNPMPIALTEWNIQAQGSKQETSFVNGMHTTLNLGELIRNKYGMAMKWDLSNGYNNGDDMGLFSSNDESDVPYRTPHPQFHYMYFFQKCFGDHLVNSSLKGNSNVVAYASSFQSGHCGLVLVNKSKYEQKVSVSFKNFEPGKHYYIYTLTGGTDNGYFSRKVFINGIGPSRPAGGSDNYATIKPYGLTTDDSIRLSMPPLSVIYAIIDPKDIPDIKWAKITDSTNIIRVKLTNAVQIADSSKGFKVTLNGSVNDSITSIERDLSDSTLLLIKLNTPVVKTDNVTISYINGNIKTSNGLKLLENSKFNVENLLKGSVPKILDAITDTTGSYILIYFDKKMINTTSSALKVNISYLDSHDASFSFKGFFNGDSTVYSLAIDEPMYYDYKIKLSYSGTEIKSSDGGILQNIDSLIVRNFSPIKHATIQQAYTSVGGDTIFVSFDKVLNAISGLTPYFKVTMNGSDTTVRGVIFKANLPNYLIIPVRKLILISDNIKISYSGTKLTSFDNVVVDTFNSRIVEDRSTLTTGIKKIDVQTFRLYPNPAKEQLTIESPVAFNKIEVFNVDGKLMYEKSFDSAIKTSNLRMKLTRGTYVMKISNNETYLTSKFVIE